MESEIETDTRELTWILGQICVALRGLTPSQLNWRPDIAHGNSAYAIATHVVSATRVYALGFGCGHPVHRDRPPRELWGTGDLHEISARDALVESIRHAALHLGELRLTRDLALDASRKD